MYGKAFASMYTGSMYGAGFAVFAVWNYALANADETGEVEINPDLVAGTLGGSVGEVEEAVAYLCAPDPRSRSGDQEGRRLIPTGAYSYHVVNLAHYKAIRDREARRTYFREAKRRQRERVDESKTGEDTSLTVKDSQGMSTMSTQVEVEVEVERETTTTKEPAASKTVFDNDEGEQRQSKGVVARGARATLNGMTRAQYYERIREAWSQGLWNNPAMGVGSLPRSDLKIDVRWWEDTVPLALVERAVRTVCEGFNPTATNRAPNSFRYFDRAVRAATQATERDEAAREVFG